MLWGLKARLLVVHYAITRSFWFLPGLMSLGALALAFLTRSNGEIGVVDEFLREHSVLAAGPEATRLILSTTLGSIITVTSLVFSMALVALSRASQQLGPRLLQSFMGDTFNQVVLGSFVATFVHALITLAIVPDPIPGVALACSILMVLVCFVLLIFFLHHTAQFMQADNVVAQVKHDLSHLIHRTCPEHTASAADAAPWTKIDQPVELKAPRSGYIQSIDLERLVDLADNHDVRIEIDYRAGHFVLEHAVIGRAGDKKAMTDRIRRDICACVVVGSSRTAAQDIEFPIKALVEIALRALSPGINDTFTAVAVIDNLSAAMSEIMLRDMPATHLGRGEVPGVKVDQVTFDGVFASAFHPIRQNLDGNVVGLVRMADAMTELSAFVRRPEHAEALRSQADMLHDTISQSISNESDRGLALARLRQAKGAIEVAAKAAETA